MAPMEKDYPGYWGEPTATIDWCEANYEVSYYVAEFWNTISNVVMIVPPIYAAYLAYVDHLEMRFICSHLAILVVGLGSWCFHGTLLYNMQLMDELPMIWGSAVLLYSLMEVDGKPKSHNYILQLGLFLYCLLVTVVYIVIKIPIFHEIAYALMVFGMLMYSLRIVRRFEHSFMLFLLGYGTYILGFLIWNMDNIFCKSLRLIRSQVSSPLRPLLQGHAWWHMLAGTGTYLGILFSTHARLKYLKRTVSTQVYFCNKSKKIMTLMPTEEANFSNYVELSMALHVEMQESKPSALLPTEVIMR